MDNEKNIFIDNKKMDDLSNLLDKLSPNESFFADVKLQINDVKRLRELFETINSEKE